MTAPIARRSFDPTRLTDWTNVLHHAAAVPKGSPDYADAQATINLALLQIQHLNRTANQADRNAAEGGPVGAVTSGLGGFAHGLSLGTGEVIAGAASDPRVRAAMSLIPGGEAIGALAHPSGARTFGEGAQAYREGMTRLE
jgi:hypothetical protein